MSGTTVTATINTAARGPRGHTGPAAEITQAAVEAALADKPAFRAALGVPAIGQLSYLDVSRYGTVANGVTNDTAAFAACFAEAVSSGVKRVYVPAGSYALQDLSIPSGIHIFGAGTAGGTAWAATEVPAPVTRFFPVNASANVLLLGLGGDISGNVIENIDIEYVSLSATSTGYGIVLQHATPGTWPGAGFWLKNSTVRNFARGLYSRSANRVHIENSHLVQCDWGLYMEGSTASLAVVNSELGGTPKDGGNGVGFYLSNVKGFSFQGCEFGNCYQVGHVEWSSVGVMDGCNFETIDGPCWIENRGQLVVSGASPSGNSGGNVAMVRSNHSAAGARTTFINVQVRSFAAFFDSRPLLWETNRTDDAPPIFINSEGAARRASSDFSATQLRWSDRSPWPQNKTRKQLIPWTGHTATVTSSSIASVRSGGIFLSVWSTAASSAVANSSGGNLLPSLYRQGSLNFDDFSWSAPLEIRFILHRLAQTGTITADADARLLFGAPYNQTTINTLSDKGIGIECNGDAVSLLVHNGAALASASLGTVGDKDSAEIILRYDGAGTLYGSLNGGTEVILTGGPTGDSFPYSHSILAAAWNTDGGGVILTSVTEMEISYY